MTKAIEKIQTASNCDERADDGGVTLRPALVDDSLSSNKMTTGLKSKIMQETSKYEKKKWEKNSKHEALCQRSLQLMMIICLHCGQIRFTIHMKSDIVHRLRSFVAAEM
jgi:hypothetical protein